MPIQFRDRKKEQKEIDESLKSGKFEFLIIYGRRRIGKTELILHTTRKKKRIYYLATTENNLERFFDVCSKHQHDVEGLKRDFEVLFSFLKDKADVVIIDEFQNMVKENKNILSLFQSIVDTELKGSKLKLVLLGSSVSLMTSKVLPYSSPLYGRRTASLKLRPIPFFNLNEFFPKATTEELAEIFGFADGIPFYLVRIDRDFWTWLEYELKQEKSFLRDEIDFLMRYEFDDPSTYKLILQAIAFGHTKLNEIKDFIKVKRTDLSPYLKNLIEVDFIKREVPITENVKSRFGRYYLNDNFLRFWFRYIYPNLSAIEEGIFNTSTIKQDYSSYLGFVFEGIAKQYLIKSEIFNFTKIGRWWHRENEMDLVALNENTKEALFAECKWKDNINAEKILRELSEKAKLVQWHNEKRKESFAIFAKSFSKRVKEWNGKKAYCFDLKDLENAFKS